MIAAIVCHSIAHGQQPPSDPTRNEGKTKFVNNSGRNVNLFTFPPDNPGTKQLIQQSIQDGIQMTLDSPIVGIKFAVQEDSCHDCALHYFIASDHRQATVLYDDDSDGLKIDFSDNEMEEGRDDSKDTDQSCAANEETVGDMDKILRGRYTLVDINVRSSMFDGNDQYTAKGIFCKIDWRLQYKNPSAVSFFHDLRAQSASCDNKSAITVDLWDIAQKAREYDQTNQDVVAAIPPHGVIFHETRCGSTLTANLLAGFAPSKSRVYSESPPPLAALEAGNVRLIQDVFYLMGRRPASSGDPKQYYQFYKIQSVGTMYIDRFTEALPDTPWIFLYRDSVEVLQSHVEGTGEACTRYYYSNREQFPSTQQVIDDARLTMESITLLQYCAAHLAGLSLSAVQEHQRSGRRKGRFVNYNQLPDIMWESVLPEEFGVSVNKRHIKNMQRIAGVYSKGRQGIAKSNQEWKEDSSRKLSAASQPVLDAAELLMRRIFDQMESLSKS